MTVWSPQQNEAISKAAAWLRMRWSPTFYLAGYAGTGKSTLARHLADQCDDKVEYAAFTGKAAEVMRRKGCFGAQTIHSLIYDTQIDPISGKATSFLKPPSALANVGLIIIDECSMVDEEMGKDLLSFGKPILVLGDPAQLPPINGGGYFTSGEPDYMLTDIHRQAAESTIVRLATAIREGRYRGDIVNAPDLTICKRVDLDPRLVTASDMVICGRNKTRQKFNQRFRDIYKKGTLHPTRGEPVICLRNCKATKVFNGQTFEVLKSRRLPKSGQILLEVRPDGSANPVTVRVHEQFFQDDVKAAKEIPYSELRGTQQFTFAYTITCHKSQGSQWDRVCVFDESDAFRSDAQCWLYTAVTRAAEHLTLVI